MRAHIDRDAPIAQLVEQLPLKEMVLGSNPSGRTRSKKQTALLFRTLVRAGVLPCTCTAARQGRAAICATAQIERITTRCEAQRCFALAKPRAGVASEFRDGRIRLVTTKTKRHDLQNCT